MQEPQRLRIRALNIKLVILFRTIVPRGIAFENECSVFRRFLSYGLNVDFETKGAGAENAPKAL
jgi:hypothetical protein